VTVTATLSTGPKLGKTDKGVHIIRLSPEAAFAEVIGKNPSKEQLLAEAAKHVGAPAKTDIVVYDHKPWHVVNGQLRPHPQVHDEDKKTILNLSFKDQDKAVWWSEQRFSITRINRSPHHPAVAGSPEYPFNPPARPYDAQLEQDDHGRTIFVVRATPIVEKSIGQMYKISFFMEEDIDPDMSCTP
jgi:hypothetical protein